MGGVGKPGNVESVLASAVYAMVIVVWERQRRVDAGKAALTALVMIYFSFYMFPTRIHERYIYHFLLLSIPFAVSGWRFLVAYLIVTLVGLSSFFFFPAYLAGYQAVTLRVLPRWMPPALMILAYLLVLYSYLRGEMLCGPARSSIDHGTSLRCKPSWFRLGKGMSLGLVCLTIGAVLFVHRAGSVTCLHELLPTAVVEDIGADGSVSRPEFLAARASFDYPGRDWWTVGQRREYFEGVVRRPILLHPKIETDRSITFTKVTGKAIWFGYGFSDQVKANNDPSKMVLQVASRGELLLDRVVDPVMGFHEVRIPLDERAQAADLTVRILPLGRSLDFLHFYFDGRLEM